MRNENADRKNKYTVWRVATGSQHTFHTTALEVDTRDDYQGTKTERKMEGEEKKVGYHSGSWLLEITSPKPSST